MPDGRVSVLLSQANSVRLIGIGVNASPRNRSPNTATSPSETLNWTAPRLSAILPVLEGYADDYGLVVGRKGYGGCADHVSVGIPDRNRNVHGEAARIHYGYGGG